MNTDHLPANIRNPVKKRAVLLTLLEELDKRMAEMQDRREIIMHELEGLK